jgi:hypothetical protein
LRGYFLKHPRAVRGNGEDLGTVAAVGLDGVDAVATLIEVAAFAESRS